MGFNSALLGGSDDRTPEERRVDLLNEAIIDAEQHASWWRR